VVSLRRSPNGGCILTAVLKAQKQEIANPSFQ
jgi:hypothetical protein